MQLELFTEMVGHCYFVQLNHKFDINLNFLVITQTQRFHKLHGSVYFTVQCK